MLRVKQIEKVIEGIKSGEIQTGQSLNQEVSLTRPGDTRWGSHYRTLVSLTNLFSPILDVLEIVQKDAQSRDKRMEASGLLKRMESFEFVFLLVLMTKVLGITNYLSQALQRKDQDLSNAMVLVEISRERLQQLREDGWDVIFKKTCGLCAKYEIDVPNMESVLVVQGRRRRRIGKMTHLHHFKVEIFYAVIDTQLQELNDRFNNVNSRLLSSMACLDPHNSFSSLNNLKLCEFASFYHYNFSDNDLIILEYQLENYIFDMRNSDFSNLHSIGELAQKIVEKGKHLAYHLVYLMVKLALIFTVATASVERVFFAMKLVKSLLCNRMGDEWINDCVVIYIERDVFETIESLIMRQLCKHFIR